MNESFEATVSSMGRKKIINVPAKSKIGVGDRVKVTNRAKKNGKM